MTEDSVVVLQELKIESPHDPAFLLLGTHAKDFKAGPRGDSYVPMFTAALVLRAKGGSELSVHPQKNGSTKYGTGTQLNSQPEKKETQACATTCMDSEDTVRSEVNQHKGQML